MDQSMICLPSDVKTALEKTSFIKRYEMLSNTFNGERTPLHERLRYIDGEIVLDSLAQLGYKAHFESKEKYFWIEEVQIGTYTFSSNMILDGGLVDIVWIVKENGNLILGLPIGEYSRLMIAPSSSASLKSSSGVSFEENIISCPLIPTASDIRSSV